MIRAGHERVLRARFADARFFWETDQKCRLADYLPKLEAVTYQAKLGSYGEKVERVRALARWLAEQWFASGIPQASVGAADRAAELAKCDLVTDMVREFTELQGIVGGLYAKAQGEPEEVAWAVYDQYKPAGLDDPIPRNMTGQALALADKMDSLVGLFCRRPGSVGIERSVRSAPGGDGNRKDTDRNEIARVAFADDRAIGTHAGKVARTRLWFHPRCEKQVLEFPPRTRAIRVEGTGGLGLR